MTFIFVTWNQSQLSPRHHSNHVTFGQVTRSIYNERKSQGSFYFVTLYQGVKLIGDQVKPSVSTALCAILTKWLTKGPPQSGFCLFAEIGEGEVNVKSIIRKYKMILLPSIYKLGFTLIIQMHSHILSRSSNQQIQIRQEV